MRKLQLAAVAVLLVSGVGYYASLTTPPSAPVALVSVDPLAGCLAHYPDRCLARERHACNYEPLCVAAAEVRCQARAAARCPVIVTP